jgi:hypothetical protein
MLIALLLGCPAPEAVKDHVPPDSGPADSGATGDTADTGDSGGGGGDTLEFAAGDLHLAIPTYVSATDPSWATWEAGAAATGGLIILNPNSGPGGHADDAYVAAVLAAQADGVRVIGYVATGYGEREAGEIDSEIAKYFTWYGVDGIFFDEVAEDCPTYAPWYAERAAAANALAPSGDAFVAYNPGLITCADYLGAADVLVVAEDGLPMLRSFVAADWMAGYNPSRFWFLAYQVGPSTLGETLQLARDAGVGWAYLTDGNEPNPWNRPPAYFADEVAAVAADGP